MLGKKIILNDAIRHIISDARKSRLQNNPNLTADQISEQIGRSKSWLSQVENGRLKTVKTRDFVNAYCVIMDMDYTFEYDYNQAAKRLDGEIMRINALIQHKIADNEGNIIDFNECVFFDQTRGHLRQAGKMLNIYLKNALELPIEEIERSIKSEIRDMLKNVVYWINRAFSDTEEMFSDEVSTKNLYCLFETAYNIYDVHHVYYGLNPILISIADLKKLKEKLNTDCFEKPRTALKPINDYSLSEFNEVVKNFSSEEYMQWKNKQIYLGDDPFPMVIAYKTLSDRQPSRYVDYPDLNKAAGLSEQDYLYIIKQIYTQFDIFYKYYKTQMEDNESLDLQNEKCYEEIEQLKATIASLTKEAIDK